MKKIIYILSVIVLASSCKNIEKMVEQGKYDEAIEYAASKLHGEKNKNTSDSHHRRRDVLRTLELWQQT